MQTYNQIKPYVQGCLEFTQQTQQTQQQYFILKSQCADIRTLQMLTLAIVDIVETCFLVINVVIQQTQQRFFFQYRARHNRHSRDFFFNYSQPQQPFIFHLLTRHSRHSRDFFSIISQPQQPFIFLFIKQTQQTQQRFFFQYLAKHSSHSRDFFSNNQPAIVAIYFSIY